MPKTISDQTIESLCDVLYYLWEMERKTIRAGFPELDDALKGLKEREGVFDGIVGDVLISWEEVCGQSAEEVLGDLYS